MTEDNATMLVLGGHGVLGTMIAEAPQTAGWTAIRSSRRRGAAICLQAPDAIVFAVGDGLVTATVDPIQGHGRQRTTWSISPDGHLATSPSLSEPLTVNPIWLSDLSD
jgi:hypothetical protein